jgi:hypothetical protein
VKGEGTGGQGTSKDFTHTNVFIKVKPKKAVFENGLWL